ncbi:MAG: AAA family ATPase [Hominimerdicola sp.]
MRPLKITVSAVGPYSGMTEIDMTILGNNGLFLVTGETGAGKTTIFDAICFALYGKASGNEREADMLRCKNAPDDILTFVEMEFEYGGKCYTVYREPTQDRKKKRGEGFTSSPAVAYLKNSAGEVITSTLSETNAKIMEIIGLDSVQFRQISMIAQGEFRKLLLSSTKERGEILSAIFSTSKFRMLTDKIKEEYLSLKKENEKLRASVLQYASGIKADNENPMRENFEKLLSDKTYVSCEELSKLADDLNMWEQDCCQKADKDFESCDKRYNEKKARLVEAERQEKISEEILKCNNLLDEKGKLFVKIKSDLEQEKQKIPQRTSLSEEIVRNKELLKNYDEADKISKEIVSLQNERIKQSEMLDKTKLEMEQLQADKSEFEKLFNSLENCDTDKIKTENLIEKKLAEQNDFQELLTTIEYSQELKESAENAMEKYLVCAKEYETEQKLTASIELAFFNEQAGFIAKSLKDNEKCPVCGSLNHPQPAKLSENVPDKTAVDKAKQNLEQMNKKLSRLSEESRDAKNLYNNEIASIQRISAKLIPNCEPEKIEEKALLKMTDIKSEIENLQNSLKKINENIKLRIELETKLEQNTHHLELCKNSKTEYEKTLFGLDTAEKEKNIQLEEIKKSLPFESREEQEKLIESQEQKKAEMDKAFEEAESTYNQLEKDIIALKKQLETLEGPIDKSEKLSSAELKEEAARLEKQRSLLLEKRDKCKSRLDSNIFAAKSMKKTAKAVESAEKKLSWLNGLYVTATGSVSKISLETYVQMAYFDKILERANVRLMVMSSGQYELVRRKETGGKSQTGLEIDAIDHFAGGTRNVQTLSGGESFMASLSLALGLADEIQANAGGIRLESMFIDEGFGSLDEESLNQAMKALSDLTEGSKLVGIISHVAELKERIPKQIIVKKDKFSGSKVSIVTDIS